MQLQSHSVQCLICQHPVAFQYDATATACRIIAQCPNCKDTLTITYGNPKTRHYQNRRPR